MTNKNLFILILVVIIAGAAYFAYQGGLFGDRRSTKSTLSALEIARISNNFIENVAIKKDRRGYGDFWRPHFLCSQAKCNPEILIRDGELFSTYYLPTLHIQNLRLLAAAADDREIKKREIAETLYQVQICKIKPDLCRRNFSAIVNADADYKFNVSLLGAFLINDFGIKPQNLVTWIQKLERFVLLAKVTGKDADITRARQVFDDGGALFSRESKLVYKENTLSITRASCFEPLGGMYVYSLTGNKDDLNSARDFAESAALAAHAKDFNKSDVLNGVIIHPGLVCGELLASLYNFTKEDRYINELKGLMQYLILENVDFQKSPLANGDGAFSRKIANGKVDKQSIDTLWFNHILLQIPNETFGVPF